MTKVIENGKPLSYYHEHENDISKNSINILNYYFVLSLTNVLKLRYEK